MIKYKSDKYDLTFDYLFLEKIFLNYHSYCEKNSIIPLLTLEEFYNTEYYDLEIFNQNNINSFIYFAKLNGLLL